MSGKGGLYGETRAVQQRELDFIAFTIDEAFLPAALTAQPMTDQQFAKLLQATC